MTCHTNTGHKGIKAIITAGGSSQRFGSNKLLEKINGKTVIETTVEKFLPLVEEVIIPTGKDVEACLLKRYMGANITFALPGETRQKSIFNALKICGNCEYVLIHDGARAFITEDTILKTIRQVKLKKAVVVGVKAIDTIKICDSCGKIVETPKRENVFHAQTPQAFEYEMILSAHQKLDGSNYTDDASMIEHLRQDVYMIEGDYSNIKITTRADLP